MKNIKSMKLVVILSILCMVIIFCGSALNVFAAEGDYNMTIHVANERNWENTNIYWWFENYESMGVIDSKGYPIDDGYIKGESWFINGKKDENNTGWHKVDCSFNSSDLIGMNFCQGDESEFRTSDIEWYKYSNTNEIWVTILNEYNARGRVRLDISTEKPDGWNDVIEYESNKEIKLKNYKGRDFEEVKKELNSKGLTVKLEKVYNSKKAVDSVLKTYPKEGNKVNKDSEVTLYVCKRKYVLDLNNLNLNGVTIDTRLDKAIEKFGKPLSYEETIGGFLLDYDGFEIFAWKNSMISEITVYDKTVKIKKGIGLGSSFENIVKKFGQPTDNFGYRYYFNEDLTKYGFFYVDFSDENRAVQIALTNAVG